MARTVENDDLQASSRGVTKLLRVLRRSVIHTTPHNVGLVALGDRAHDAALFRPAAVPSASHTIHTEDEGTTGGAEEEAAPDRRPSVCGRKARRHQEGHLLHNAAR